MTKILVGTCGFYYTDWLGPVYPEGTTKKDFLSLYAELFKTVELDYTYYSMPKAENMSKMLMDGGPDLTFSVKAHQSLTHKIDPAKWEENVKTYREAIDPMLQAERLEAVLFQFPYSFKYEEKNRRYLDRLLSFFNGVPLAVEFRVNEWFNDRLIEGMKKRQICLVSLDMPELPHLPPALDLVTAPLSYIRLHGRNKGAWWGSDEVARYDYLYNEQELSEWVDRLKMVALEADKILIYFNNHFKGQAVQNGQTLMKILKKTGLLADM